MEKNQQSGRRLRALQGERASEEPSRRSVRRTFITGMSSVLFQDACTQIHHMSFLGDPQLIHRCSKSNGLGHPQLISWKRKKVESFHGSSLGWRYRGMFREQSVR